MDAGPAASAATAQPRSAAPVEGVLGAIGETPLVRLRRYSDRRDLKIWAKLERGNPGGSAKARPAAAMLLAALERGELPAGGTVIESSSGNMGIGLAQACASLGLRLICVTDSRANPASIGSIRALGAEVRVVSEPDPDSGELLAARMQMVEELVRTTPGAWWPNQYANPANAGAHREGTMREIDEALGGRLDFLFVATSTAGTLAGCSQCLRERGRPTEVVAVDAVGSALFGGERSPRHLPGMGAGVETTLSRSAGYDRLVRVRDIDSVVGCRRLARREGILAGASSGGVLTAIDALAAELPPEARCAAILPDGGESYLHTVFDDAWVERELGYEAGELERLVGRVPAPIRSAGPAT